MGEALQGKNYGYDQEIEVYRFFDCTGCERDGEWYRNSGIPRDGLTPMWEAEVERQRLFIRELIADRKGASFAFILVNAATAISLCLEGILTPMHFSAMRETDDYVDISSVEFDGEILKVRVRESTQTPLCLVDNDDEEALV
jgi:hypothetical protein